ncbi:MAG: serine/threonine protein kinase [Candidatus Eisenbacteria bacterium]|nr:serine/threonine protein kinase [Candidatus Eisenbacteria bacterium]
MELDDLLQEIVRADRENEQRRGTGDPEPPIPPLQIGPYTLIRSIALGATSEVFEGQAPDGTAVAVKLFHPERMIYDAVRHSAREASFLRSLHHPNIPRLLDSGTVRVEGQDVAYMVLDLVRGTRLEDFLAEERPTLCRAAELLAIVAEALHAVHRHGLVHRDVKPQNIVITSAIPPKARSFMTSSGPKTAMLVDFGVAWRTDAGQLPRSSVHGTRILAGTPGYLSPEHFTPSDLGPASDVYSLAVVGYEAVVGRLPFDQSKLVPNALHIAPLNSPLVPLPPHPQFRDIGFVLFRALDRDPAKRYPTAVDFADDLWRVSRGDRPAARPRPIARTVSFIRRALQQRAAIFLLIAGIPMLWFGLGMIERGRSDRREDRSLKALVSEVKSIDAIRHASDLGEADMRECISRLQVCRQALRRLSTSPLVPHLEAYAWFREGELHYFLGTLHTEREEYLRAADCWNAGGKIPRTREGLVVLSSDPSLRSQIAGINSLAFASADGLAHRALSRITSPRSEQRISLERYEWACAAARNEGRDLFFYDPLRFPDDKWTERGAVPDAISSLTFNRAIGLLDLGITTDDPELIEQSLEGFAVADTFSVTRKAGDGYQACLYGWGRAYFARAELLRTPDGLDSCLAKYEAALGVDELLPDDLTLEATARSACLRLEAELATDPATRAQHLRRARAIWHPDPSGAAVLSQRSVNFKSCLEQSAVALSIAGLCLEARFRPHWRSPAPAAVVEEALAWVDSAATRVDQERQPVLWAQVLLARASARRVAWQWTGNEQLRRAAQGDLETSLQLLPPSQSPRHARLTRIEQDRLASDPPHAASFRIHR